MRIDLTAYATDCIVHGSLELRYDRLSDLLAEELLVQITNASLSALEDGQIAHLPALELKRVETALVAATGPRGNAGRRLPTVRRPMVAVVGPYEIAGRLHGPPSTDPFELIRRRPWVAVTDAVVRYRVRGRPIATPHAGLIVNTGLITVIDTLEETALDLRLAAFARLAQPATHAHLVV